MPLHLPRPDSYNYCNYYWAGPRRPDPEQLRCVLIMLVIFIIVILNYNNYNTYKSQSPRYIIIIINFISYNYKSGASGLYNYCTYYNSYYAGLGRPDPEQLRFIISMSIIIIIIITINYTTYKITSGVFGIYNKFNYDT